MKAMKFEILDCIHDYSSFTLYMSILYINIYNRNLERTKSIDVFCLGEQNLSSDVILKEKILELTLNGTKQRYPSNFTLKG